MLPKPTGKNNKILTAFKNRNSLQLVENILVSKVESQYRIELRAGNIQLKVVKKNCRDFCVYVLYNLYKNF